LSNSFTKASTAHRIFSFLLELWYFYGDLFFSNESSSFGLLRSFCSSGVSLMFYFGCSVSRLESDYFGCSIRDCSFYFGNSIPNFSLESYFVSSGLASMRVGSGLTSTLSTLLSTLASNLSILSCLFSTLSGLLSTDRY